MFRQVGGQRSPAPCTRNPVLGTLAVEHPWKRQDDPAPRHGDSIHLTGFSFAPDPHPHLRGGAGSGRVNHIGWVRASSTCRCRGHSCWHLTHEWICFHARCTQNARRDANIALHDAGGFICLAGVDVSLEGSSCKGARRYTPPGMHGHLRPGIANSRADDGDQPCGVH